MQRTSFLLGVKQDSEAGIGAAETSGLVVHAESVRARRGLLCVGRQPGDPGGRARGARRHSSGGELGGVEKMTPTLLRCREFKQPLPRVCMAFVVEPSTPRSCTLVRGAPFKVACTEHAAKVLPTPVEDVSGLSIRSIGPEDCTLRAAKW
jgi:hypothetical protein